MWGQVYGLVFVYDSMSTFDSQLTSLQRKKARKGKLSKEKSDFPVLLAATAAAALVGLLVLRRYAINFSGTQQPVESTASKPTL